MMEKSKLILMGYVIQEYLISKNIEYAKSKDLMPLLIDKGFFNSDHRQGLPLRNILRQLDDQNMLYLIPQVIVERKDKKRLWMFYPVKL